MVMELHCSYLDRFVEQGYDPTPAWGDLCLKAHRLWKESRVPAFTANAQSAGDAADPMITSDPLAHLVGEEWKAVVAARIAPYDSTRLNGAMDLLRRNQRLAEVDALYNAAPHAMQCDAAVISVWCSIPRMRGDGPEMLRRATEMFRLHPKDVKACSHMIFALYATKGFDETMRQAEIWMAEFPDNENIIAPVAIVASDSQHWSVSEQLLRKLTRIFPQGMDAGNCFRLVVALRCLAKPDEAARVLDEARGKFPDHPLLTQL
jgi:hypothetical protein